MLQAGSVGCGLGQGFHGAGGMWRWGPRAPLGIAALPSLAVQPWAGSWPPCASVMTPAPASEGFMGLKSTCTGEALRSFAQHTEPLSAC